MFLKVQYKLHIIYAGYSYALQYLRPTLYVLHKRVKQYIHYGDHKNLLDLTSPLAYALNIKEPVTILY